MDLPGAQNQLIKALSKVNKNTIVVLTNGTPVSMMEWIDDVPAVLEAFYPGQEEGNAIADILFGDVNPSGKLPVTFPKYYNDNPAYDCYPSKNSELSYDEGIYVGYRYYDTKNVEPLFPFGYGLSYTEFKYNNISLSKDIISINEVLKIKATIKNTGNYDGDEIVQLYIRDVKSKIDRPFKELKGFKRINLQQGESKTIEFEIDKTALSYYDADKKQWIADAGEFEVLIGSSSKDIQLKKKFELK